MVLIHRLGFCHVYATRLSPRSQLCPALAVKERAAGAGATPLARPEKSCHRNSVVRVSHRLQVKTSEKIYWGSAGFNATRRRDHLYLVSSRLYRGHLRGCKVDHRWRRQSRQHVEMGKCAATSQDWRPCQQWVSSLCIRSCSLKSRPW